MQVKDKQELRLNRQRIKYLSTNMDLYVHLDHLSILVWHTVGQVPKQNQ